MVVERSSPPLICPPTKGVISIPLWARAIGAATTVQTIAAHRRLVFIFALLPHSYSGHRLRRGPRFPGNCKLSQPQSFNPMKAVTNRVDCSEKNQFVCL